MTFLRQAIFGVSLVLSGFTSFAQTTVFAELQGNPVNTAGWNLTGAATVSTNELVLTPVTVNQGTSGGVFWNQPMNLTQCQKWKAEFEFRMYGGTGADGIAFCFLDVPPSGFVVGGGVGIPATANGLKVVFDTFENQFGTAANPQIQIRYGVGYHQFNPPFNSQPSTATGQYFLRSNNYQPARIEYDNGNISVYVNNTLYLTGFYLINFTGYVGFTASTGGESDRHSIRNVTIYADIAPSNAGADVSYCSGGSVQIGTTPNPNYNYSWSPSIGLSATNIANPTVSLTNTGNTPLNFTYTVTTTLSGSGTACSTQDQVVVTVNPVPTSPFNLSKNNVCPGEPVTITYTGNMGPAAAYTWNFSGATVISGSGQGPYQVSWPASGVQPVSLSVSQYGCTSTVTTKNVTVNPVPLIGISGNDSICPGDTTIFTGVSSVPGAVFTWQPNYGPGNPVHLSPSVTTQYTVSATVPNGCPSADTVFTVTVKPKPVAGITGDTLICKGDTIQLSGSSSLFNSSFLWLPDLQTVNPVSVGPPVNTTYRLVVAKDGCLSDTAVFLLAVDSVPNLTVPDSIQICIGDEVDAKVNSTTPGTQFNWQPGDLSGTENILKPTVTTAYSVYAYNATCTSATKVFEVEVLQNCECQLVVPNAFTPNGDQVNDEYRILNPQQCDIATFDLVLYNRWGAVVFKSADIQHAWDGNFLGSKCSDGTYFYVFRYSYLPGGQEAAKVVTEKGTVVLSK